MIDDGLSPRQLFIRYWSTDDIGQVYKENNCGSANTIKTLLKADFLRYIDERDIGKFLVLSRNPVDQRMIDHFIYLTITDLGEEVLWMNKL